MCKIYTRSNNVCTTAGNLIHVNRSTAKRAKENIRVQFKMHIYKISTFKVPPFIYREEPTRQMCVRGKPPRPLILEILLCARLRWVSLQHCSRPLISLKLLSE